MMTTMLNTKLGTMRYLRQKKCDISNHVKYVFKTCVSLMVHFDKKRKQVFIRQFVSL